ncbi:acyl carrier protein [Gigaspora margarita]|uniref:Acyl carrier protein n=1 Tax=Gigaspora margarita TaxID=4874 RepID=A0A8H4AFL0_GIGMA|nr:acyl carrier protein [Gigaspora margarita]
MKTTIFGFLIAFVAIVAVASGYERRDVYYSKRVAEPERGAYSKRVAEERGQCNSDTKNRVIDNIAEFFGVNKEQITPETTFLDDLGADEFDMSEFGVGLDEEFDITIPEDDLENFVSVKDVIDYICAHVKND